MIIRKHTECIIYHHSLSKDVGVDVIRKWHMVRTDAKFEDIGYHFIIRKDGSIEIGRPVNMVGAHALGMNDSSIGVCITGDFRKECASNRQYVSATYLHIKLCEIYEKKLDVRFHHKRCPGSKFDRDALESVTMRNVRQLFDG